MNMRIKILNVASFRDRERENYSFIDFYRSMGMMNSMEILLAYFYFYSTIKAF